MPGMFTAILQSDQTVAPVVVVVVVVVVGVVVVVVVVGVVVVVVGEAVVVVVGVVVVVAVVTVEKGHWGPWDFRCLRALMARRKRIKKERAVFMGRFFLGLEVLWIRKNRGKGIRGRIYIRYEILGEIRVNFGCLSYIYIRYENSNFAIFFLLRKMFFH